jgi:uncharacterized FlaG/YvyC family protein
MPNQITDRITKTDLDKIEASLKQVIEVAKTQKTQADIDDMLKTLSTTVHHLKTKIEFDHEKRLAAIEEFLQNL